MPSLQVVAVLFSRFEEVLYLDSDNLALRDPTGASSVVPKHTHLRLFTR
jgi:hypothetical protein